MNRIPQWANATSQVAKELSGITNAARFLSKPHNRQMTQKRRALYRLLYSLSVAYSNALATVSSTYRGDVYLVSPPDGDDVRMVNGIPQSSAVDALMGVAARVCNEFKSAPNSDAVDVNR